MDTTAITSFLTTTVTELGIKVLAALAFWIVGRWLIGRVIGLVQGAMNRNSVDATLTKYLGSIMAVALVCRDAGRRGRGHRCGLERHAGQLRRRRVHARAASLQGG